MSPTRVKRIRTLLWLYFWLLIIEGALRKWILPGLSNPLLLVRDPVALLALWWGLPLLRQRRWRFWIDPLFALGSISFLFAITLGHGDAPTAAYGARILILQLPLIFLYGAVFDRRDVIQFALTLTWISIPMTFLIVIQSNLPTSHFLNVAPGGEGTAVFSGAVGRFRPPGVFSFISGLTTFYTLAASSLFIILYSEHARWRTRISSMLVSVALIVALPVSISRALLAGYLQVLLALIVALALSRSRLMPLISGLVALVVSIGIASSIPAFQEASDAFMARWEMAAVVESGDDSRLGGAVGVFQNRFLGGFTAPFQELEDAPLFGAGIGIGTNVGSQRLTGDKTFIVGEGAWEATFGEMGLPLGFVFILWRIALSYWILRLAFRQAMRGNRLPLILAGTSFLLALGGQLGQPTSLGFIVVSVGLTLASCNMSLSSTQSRDRALYGS